jgi:hypothetical protein
VSSIFLTTAKVCRHECALNGVCLRVGGRSSATGVSDRNTDVNSYPNRSSLTMRLQRRTRFRESAQRGQ